MAIQVKRPSNKEIKERTKNVLDSFRKQDFTNQPKDTRTDEQKRADTHNARNNEIARTAGSGDWKPKQVHNDKDIANERKKDALTALGAIGTAAAIPAAVAAAGGLGAAGAVEAAEGAIGKKAAEKGVEEAGETIAKKAGTKEAENIAEKETTKAAEKEATKSAEKETAKKNSPNIEEEAEEEAAPNRKLKDFLAGARAGYNGASGTYIPAFGSLSHSNPDSPNYIDIDKDDEAGEEAENAVSSSKESESASKTSSASRSSASKFANPPVASKPPASKESSFQSPKTSSPEEIQRRIRAYWGNPNVEA